MMAKAYQERLIALVRDTVTLLCKNGLEYSQEFCVEGLLGVTLDKGEVFLIPIKELVSDKGVGTGDGTEDILEQAALLSNGTEGEDSYKSPKHERRKKRKHLDCSSAPTEDDQQQNTSQTELGTEYNDSTNSNGQPTAKRTSKHSDVRQVKEEDIVVIKEEIDDQQFLDTFQGGSLDQNSLNKTEQSDNGMTLLPQPGTSQTAGVSFSLDQLARDSGLPGVMPSSFPASCGGDTSWLQHSQNELGESQEWQNQKHQWLCGICMKAFGRRSWLKRHTDSVHLKLKLAECDICGRAYSNKGNLNAHKKAAHWISNDTATTSTTIPTTSPPSSATTTNYTSPVTWSNHNTVHDSHHPTEANSSAQYTPL